MSRNARVSLELRLAGDAAARVKRLWQDAAKGAKDTKNATDDLTRSENKSAAAAGKIKSIIQQVTTSVRAFENAQRGVTRATTDTATAQQRQSEMVKAFNTHSRQSLAQSRQLTTVMRENVAAVNAMNAAMQIGINILREEVRQSRQLRDNLNEAKRAHSGMAALRAGVGAAAGAYAVKQVLDDPVARALAYQDRVSLMANIAVSRDSENINNQSADLIPRRQKQRDIIEGMVHTAADVGGVSNDAVANALDNYYASGLYNKTDSIDATNKLIKTDLEFAAKSARAFGADINDFANLQIRAKLKGIDPSRVVGFAATAGKEGMMEVPTLARFAPQIMASLNKDATNPERQVAQAFAAAEAVRMATGTSDQAGDYMIQLLSHVDAHVTNRYFKKFFGADLGNEYMVGAAKGKTKFDVLIEQTDLALKNNEGYKVFQDAYDKAMAEGDQDKANKIATMMATSESLGLSKVFHEQQSRIALSSILLNRDFVERTTDLQLKNGGVVVEEDFAFMDKNASANIQRLKNEAEHAQYQGLKSFNEKLGETAGFLADLAKEYPDLAKYTADAALATKALAAGAMAASVPLMLIGGASVASGAAAGGAGILGALGLGAGAGGAAAGAAGLGIGAAVGTALLGLGVGWGIGNLFNYGNESLGDPLGEGVTRSLAFMGVDSAEGILDAGFYSDTAGQTPKPSRNIPVPMPVPTVTVNVDSRPVAATIEQQKFIMDRRTTPALVRPLSKWQP